MGILQRIERKLEGAVDDGFARVFGGKVAPQEVEGALQREAEDSLEDLGDGGKLVPNSYTVVVSSTDHEQMASEYELNRKTFSKHLEHFIRDNGWQTYGDVIVEFEHSPSLHTGQFRARGAIDPDAAPKPVGPPPPAPPSPHAAIPSPSMSAPPVPPRPAPPQQRPTSGHPPNAIAERGAHPMTQHSGNDPRRGYEQGDRDRGHDRGAESGYPQGSYPADNDRGYDQQGGYAAPAGYDQQGGYAPAESGQGYGRGYPEQGGSYGDQGRGDQGGQGRDDQGAGYPQGGYDPAGYRDAGQQPAYDRNPGYDPGAYRTGGGYQQGGYGQSGGYDQAGYDQNAGGGYGQAEPGYYADADYRDAGYQQGGYDQGGYAPRSGGAYQGGYDQGGYDQGSYQPAGYDQGYGAATAAPTYAPAGVTLCLEDGSNRTFSLRDGSNVIGRGQDAQFRLPDTGVSRRHVEIRWDGQVALLHDLNSTNGTTVNDVAVSSWELADGDHIRVGHSDITVRFQ